MTVKYFMKLRLETNLVLFSFSFFLLNSLWAYFLELTTLKYGRKLHLPKSKLKKKTFDLQVSLSLFSSFFYLFSLFLCKVKMSVETEYWISCLRISIQFPLILEQKKRSILSSFFSFFWCLMLSIGEVICFRICLHFSNTKNRNTFSSKSICFLQTSMFQRKIAIW